MPQDNRAECSICGKSGPDDDNQILFDWWGHKFCYPCHGEALKADGKDPNRQTTPEEVRAWVARKKGKAA